MKVVTLGWGVWLVILVSSCAGKVEPSDGSGGGGGSAGGSTAPVACPTAAGADLSKLQNKPCAKLYDGCGPGACAYGCACVNLGQGLRWLCGQAPCP